MKFSENATVVVVHGAWADGSSWRAIVHPLEDRGLNVIAAPIPLTSLSDDAAALKRTIIRTQGPVIVAGHAYAGAVIATANDEPVKALVYIAALAPDEGETVAQVFTETKLIQRPRNLLRMRTALSGCRMKGSPTPLPRMHRMSRLRCARPCSGQSQLRAFRNQPRHRPGSQSQHGTFLQKTTE
jgi:pimeloyl-ACP methyl ester carboxylesterase